MAYYLVTYDIGSQKTRQKIGDILLGYGTRVNYSVFEVEVHSKSQLKTLEEELLLLITAKSDSLRFYHICKNCVAKSWSLGEEPAPFEKEAVYFF
jgi:CRISPR-associated protein Cas2